MKTVFGLFQTIIGREPVNMDKKDIERINELARKAKTTGLSLEEEEERKALRTRYLQEFRANMKAMLDNTYIMTPDGEKRKLEQKKKPN